MTHYSYNEFHLGDNLVHLHFLRKLALANPGEVFVHAVQECHLAQLREVVADVPAVELQSLLADGYTAGPREISKWRNVWKNAGGYWERSAYRSDWVLFHLDWFRYLAGEMGLSTPLRSAENLLFDYPVLESGGGAAATALPVAAREADVLVVNSQPCSGQMKGRGEFENFDSPWYFEPLIADLVDRGHRVLTTAPTHVPRWTVSSEAGAICSRDFNLSVTGIGALSRFIPHHVMCATGPMWTTFNVFSAGARPPVQTRIVLLDHVLGEERVNILPDIVQVKHLGAARLVLREKGLL